MELCRYFGQRAVSVFLAMLICKGGTVVYVFYYGEPCRDTNYDVAIYIDERARILQS